MSECKYCKKESYGRPFCPACAKKYFNMDLPTVEQPKPKKKVQKNINNTNSLNSTRNYDSKQLENIEYKSFKDYETNKVYICKNGIKVRTLSEKIISDFLTYNNIEHTYEKEIKYQEKTQYQYYYKNKSIHPDFYIKGPVKFNNRILRDVYIEFWGLDSNEYNKTKEYKHKIYKAINFTLINVYSNDMNDIENILTYKLSNYRDKIINY